MISSRADLFKHLRPKPLAVGDRVRVNDESFDRNPSLKDNYLGNIGTVKEIRGPMPPYINRIFVHWDRPVGTESGCSNFDEHSLYVVNKSVRADLLKRMQPVHPTEFYVKFRNDKEQKTLTYIGINQCNPSTNEYADAKKFSSLQFIIYDQLIDFNFENRSTQDIADGKCVLRNKVGDMPMTIVKYMVKMLRDKSNPAIERVGDAVNVDGTNILFMVVMK